MYKRTIMVFPCFENMEVIKSIREKYDPLADLVEPHVTLVFPFESEISNEELKLHLEKCLEGIKPFKLEMSGFGTEKEEWGNYLFLNVVNGIEEIRDMHDKLYSGELKRFLWENPYKPHMTVGNAKTREEIDKAFDDVKGITDRFVTNVNKISVEMIGEHEESIIIIEHELKK